MELIPSNNLTFEWLDELLLSPEIKGVIFNFFIKTGERPRLSVALSRRNDINLAFVAIAGYYKRSKKGDRFIKRLIFNAEPFHILAPSLSPDYAYGPYSGRVLLIKMAQEKMRSIYMPDDDDEDVKIYDFDNGFRISINNSDIFNLGNDFVLSSIYNLYVYYLSIGAYPFIEMMLKIVHYLMEKGFNLPSNSPDEYFDALFSYVRLYSIEVKDEKELERCLIRTKYLQEKVWFEEKSEEKLNQIKRVSRMRGKWQGKRAICLDYNRAREFERRIVSLYFNGLFKKRSS